MLLLAGLVAFSVVTAAELGLVAVAEEAAHAAALAPTAVDAAQQGHDRGVLVAHGYALGNGSLDVRVDVDQFGQGGHVDATATYSFTGRDVFLLGLPGVTLTRTHSEPVGQHRSLP
jgi:hypothetical protein